MDFMWRSSTSMLRPLLLGAIAALVLLPSGCSLVTGQQAGTLMVDAARIDAAGAGAVLELDLDLGLSGPMQDALDHGIPLTLRIDLVAGAWPRRESVSRQVELRWFPLSRRYQLRELAGEDVRSFTTRTYLMAALTSLRLPVPAAFADLPHATRLQARVALDPGALPGALRLPALFEPAWRLAAPDYRWAAP